MFSNLYNCCLFFATSFGLVWDLLHWHRVALLVVEFPNILLASDDQSKGCPRHYCDRRSCSFSFLFQTWYKWSSRNTWKGGLKGSTKQWKARSIWPFVLLSYERPRHPCKWHLYIWRTPSSRYHYKAKVALPLISCHLLAELFNI